MDGIFGTAPSTFVQLFTILRTVSETVNGETREVALPFVYALLRSKAQEAYEKVMEVVNAEAAKIGALFEPQFILIDFELAIINACKNVVVYKYCREGKSSDKKRFR